MSGHAVLDTTTETKPLMNDLPPPYSSQIPGYGSVPQPQPYPYPYSVHPNPYVYPHSQGQAQGLGHCQSGLGPTPYVANTYSTVIHPQVSSVVVVGGCPACRVGVLEDDFTCLGILCAIIFFPIGLLCCLLLRQRHCPHCGAIFS
uniref:membrane protein BRI3-like n=1 Tax=Myxine glutinosa TaxID=7769 RepID=UPI00358F64FD